MKQIITTNYLGVRIGQKRKSVPHFFSVTLVGFHRIYADRGNPNAPRVEVGQVLLETPQLGVAEESPIPAIEN